MNIPKEEEKDVNQSDVTVVRLVSHHVTENNMRIHNTVVVV